MGRSPCPTSADGGKPCLGSVFQGVNAKGRGDALQVKASPLVLYYCIIFHIFLGVLSLIACRALCKFIYKMNSELKVFCLLFFKKVSQAFVSLPICFLSTGPKIVAITIFAASPGRYGITHIVSDGISPVPC